MNVEYIILANSAEVVKGKLYMIGGGWSQLSFAHYPASVRMSIAISFLADPDELEKPIAFQVAILNPTGAHVIPPIGGEMNMAAPADRLAVLRAMVAINGNFQIPMPGTYRVLVSSGNQPPKEVLFEAKLKDVGRPQ